MPVAIVGAGPAGLAAAHALDAPVTVFEKSRGAGGRAATRWRDVAAPSGMLDRWRFDHGAQYVSPEPDSPSARLVQDVMGGAVVEVEGAVWPFDDDGTLRPDRARDPGLRWTFRDGVAELGRRLRDATPGLDLRQRRVTRLSGGPGAWTVETDDGDRHGPFDAVLLTPPAPQTAEIVRASDLGAADADALAAALGEAEYRSQFTVVWGFRDEIERPADVYALVNAAEHGGSGGGHDVAWLAVESDKPGRAPEGATILLAQMSDAWTEAHYDDPKAEVVAAATAAVAGLWGALPEPLWTDTQRWRYSLPNAAADADALAEAAAHGLFFAGDYTAGKGRVHLALEEGLAAADRIRQPGRLGEAAGPRLRPPVGQGAVLDGLPEQAQPGVDDAQRRRAVGHERLAAALPQRGLADEREAEPDGGEPERGEPPPRGEVLADVGGGGEVGH